MSIIDMLTKEGAENKMVELFRKMVERAGVKGYEEMKGILKTAIEKDGLPFTVDTLNAILVGIYLIGKFRVMTGESNEGILAAMIMTIREDLKEETKL